jgi:hypothetical protein
VYLYSTPAVPERYVRHSHWPRFKRLPSVRPSLAKRLTPCCKFATSVTMLGPVVDSLTTRPSIWPCRVHVLDSNRPVPPLRPVSVVATVATRQPLSTLPLSTSPDATAVVE